MNQAILVNDTRVRVQERAFLQEAALPARLTGLIAFCIVYCAAPLLHVPMLRYFPALHIWSFNPIPGESSISYMGLVLYGALAWLYGYAVARIPIARRWLSVPAVSRFIIYASIAVTFCALTFILVMELREWGARMPQG